MPLARADSLVFPDPASREQAIRARIEHLTYLPTAGAVAMRLIELGRDPATNPAEYAQVISADASLCARLLALANSSWFGVRTHVTKPLAAINLLGLGTVRTLALSSCLAGLHSDLRLPPQISAELWAAALSRAVTARCFAALLDEHIAEEAFVAGLFVDLAVPVMFACAPEQISALLADQSLTTEARLEGERALFKLDHCELGCVIARHLHLPAPYADAIAFHHSHGELRQILDAPALADAVYLAGLFPHRLSAWNPQDAARLRDFYRAHEVAQRLPIEAFLERVSLEFNHLQVYFDQGPSPQVRLAELLERATCELAEDTSRLVGSVSELMSQVASAGKQVSAIQQERSDLEQAALRDSLTGAFNRDGFAREAHDTLLQAARFDRPFALLYIDLDKFKHINDLHGHDVGDLALRHLVEHIRRSIRHSDLLGRMGGDEFTALLANCPYPEAHVVAERLRADLRDHPLPTPGGAQICLSLSLGMLWVQPRGLSCLLSELLPRADQLMYEAKRQGGNRMQFVRLIHEAQPVA